MPVWAGGLWLGTAWRVGNGPLPALAGIRVLTGLRGCGCLESAPGPWGKTAD